MNDTEPKRTTFPTDRLDGALRAALQPVDPGPAFAIAVQVRLMASEARPPVAAAASVTGPRHRRLYQWALALAAAVVLAMGIAAQIQQLRGAQRAALARAQQDRVHTQLLLALEITSERLGLAQQRIEQFQAQERNP